ncbi:MAG: inverse autotransporter beta domain-containing protein [Verrucomicrobia bacterium]|nr:inverse autotransporter beta domain-containing protein [Verrucomicrobiota bacterium]
MDRKILYSLLALSSIMADDSEQCGLTVMPDRLTARHIESKGIGYNQGYTTFEGFFTNPNWTQGSLVPFLDLRGHVFNNGKMAANAGIGLRYISSMLWGVNAYYDYRKTEHQNYNQVGLGFESLGEVWDFRANGYFPVGRTKSHFYQPKFHAFKAHNMIISLKREFDMAGTNAEVGAHFSGNKYVDLYAAAGPYYFSGKGKNAIGGQGRLYGKIGDYLGLEVRGSYDNLFKGIVQGELSIIIPLGGKKNVAHNANRTCSRDRALHKRAYQRIDRQEIIVTSHKRKNRVAINPATGQPWFFWFVNNTSHSLGTIESPFPTLAQAQNASSPNDVIYVFPGDGTTTGMSLGITLKNNQKLWGSGIPQKLSTTQGTVKIPAQSSTSPKLTNTAGAGNIVTLMSGNEVSGLNLSPRVNNSNAVFSSGGITDLYVHNNVVTGTASFYSGINVTGSGSFVITDNQINGVTNLVGRGIFIITDPNALITGKTSGNAINAFDTSIQISLDNGGSADYVISNNTITNTGPSSNSIVWGNTAGTPGRSNGYIINNNLFNLQNGGILIFTGGNSQCITVANNQILGTPANTSNGITIRTLVTSTGPLNISVFNNTIDRPAAGFFGVQAFTVGATTICLDLKNNNVTNGTGYFLANALGTFNLEPLLGNSGSFSTSGTITNVTDGTCFCND